MLFCSELHQYLLPILERNYTSDYNPAHELSPSKQHVCISLIWAVVVKVIPQVAADTLAVSLVELCLSIHTLKLYCSPFVSLCYS